MFPDDIYLGDECPINLERKYDSRFVCVYDLVDYPFDTQRCHLALVMATASADFVVMERNLINFVGEKKLLEYQITERPTAENITRLINKAAKISLIRRPLFG